MRRTANPPSLKPRARTRSSSRTGSSRTSSTTSSPSTASTTCSSESRTRSPSSCRTTRFRSTRPTRRRPQLTPVLARDKWADKIMNSRSDFGEGITGWAALHREPVRTNQAHLDPRTKTVPGTPPDEAEALITVPLIARDLVKGVLNIYRLGEDASFSDEEFELADPLRRRGRARARQRADPRAARVPGADGLADRPLQPPLLPRAAAGRAHPREPLARQRRRADARHRRLQARQRRLRPRLGRPGADRPGRAAARARCAARTSSAGSAARSSA